MNARTIASEAGAPAVLPRPMELDRLEESHHARGPILSLVLPDGMEIQEGEQQNLTLFMNVGEMLHLGQWVEVSNDYGSFYALCRVDALNASPGAGVRHLSFVFISPPKRNTKGAEPVVGNGTWYWRYLGDYRKWCVVNPTGGVVRDKIRTEREAQLFCHHQMGNRLK
jgi:hypothetical protein